MKNPPFTITPAILSLTAEIAELVGHVNAASGLSANPMLRRANRIRSVHASVAIEQNTLTLTQVTAVLDGRAVPESRAVSAKARDDHHRGGTGPARCIRRNCRPHPQTLYRGGKAVQTEVRQRMDICTSDPSQFIDPISLRKDQSPCSRSPLTNNPISR